MIASRRPGSTPRRGSSWEIPRPGSSRSPRRSRASLIALSTHGRSGVARLARGSVAEEVLRNSPVPVLVANPFALKENEELPIRTILVPLDGSKRSAEILAMAEEVARLHGAELVLLHVTDLSWCHYPDVARPHELAMARGFLARDLERLNVRARSIVVEGSAPEKIIEAIASEKADLVALATHGRSGLARWYFGSVAEAVLRRAACPLLVSNGERCVERTSANLEIEAAAS